MRLLVLVVMVLFTLPYLALQPLGAGYLLDYLGGSGTSGGRDNIHACEFGLVALTFHGSDFRELLDVALCLRLN